MITTIAHWLESRFNLNYEFVSRHLSRSIVTMAAMIFIILATSIVAFEDVFPSQDLGSLQVGDIAPSDVLAPETRTFTSQVLTRRERDSAASAVIPVPTTPNSSVVRQQTQLAQAILNFVEDIRRDPYSAPEEKTADLGEISAIRLNAEQIAQILTLDNDTWRAIGNEVVRVLEQVYRNAIQVREDDLSQIRNQLLQAQIAIAFDDEERALIIALARDLIQPNTTIDEIATEQARQMAANAITAVPFSVERGQIIIAEGQPVNELDLEVLDQFGLRDPSDTRTQGIIAALLASIIVMVVMGLYASLFRPSLLYREPRTLTLLATIFLIVLLGARLGLSGEIYIYPTAALALLYVAVIGPQIAIIGVLGLAFLIGLMADTSLELTALVAVGGIIGALTLRRAERLNNFFFAGLMVAISNMAIVALFNLNIVNQNTPGEITLLLIYSLLNGILTAAAAMAGLYIVTLIFNLPTALKLAELMQPNQPLLQRLLRDAPGTYQHSLQVANLSEQAANAIDANAELTHVAALYHDIGKMENPAFFTENQRDIGNPHDALNDPYRSADIIISHATDGDDMARQYRLPNRIRDFIREHHGTSQVYVFYKQAVILAGDENLVDIADFTYPGPKPQSRETAILMLADSCEASVRSREPKTKQEIEEIIDQVFDGKRKGGQLDESGLTLNDLNKIRNIFIEILQGMFHPRINYDEAIARVKNKGTAAPIRTTQPSTQSTEIAAKRRETPAVTANPEKTVENPPKANGKPSPSKRQTMEIPRPDDDDDDAPIAEVPRLRRSTENKTVTISSETEQAQADDGNGDQKETEGKQENS